MKRLFKKAIVVFLFVIVCGAADAMNWPSEDAVLIRSFGSNNRGQPVLGMIFNGGTEILASEKGEIIFSRSSSDTASRLPSPLGAWTALDHGDGLISIYSRYENNSVSLTQAERSQQIAVSGTSGWSQQDGFYFMIFDRRDRRWINPAMVITPLQSPNPVQIVSVQFKNAQGVLVQSNELNHGRYSVLVNAVNPAAPLAQRNFLAPHRIVCSVNGAEAGALNFESFYARDGVLMIYRNGLVPARQVYAEFPAYEAAEVLLTRGQANMEIIVQNITGNSSRQALRLVVN